MPEAEIYNVIRQEIITNHNLMHWITLLVAVSLLIGCRIIEKRKTIICVFLPLVSVAWAASVLRFDYFIHRQASYLRAFEFQMQKSGFAFPLWETWKAEHRSGIFIVPFADLIVFLLIIIPTAFILFNYTQQYFSEKKWKFGKVYVWTILTLLIVLLLLSPFVPFITQT
jgi:hypothetical protein